jgi:hypothetical protein
LKPEEGKEFFKLQRFIKKVFDQNLKFSVGLKIVKTQEKGAELLKIKNEGKNKQY